MKPFKLLILCCISLAKSSFASEIKVTDGVVELRNVHQPNNTLQIEFFDNDKAKQIKFEAKLSDSVWSSTFLDREQIKIAKSRNVLDKVNATEYTVLWIGKDLTSKQQICFFHGDLIWYPTFFDFSEPFYPLSVSKDFKTHTLVTLPPHSKTTGVSGDLLENLFITTAGFAIMLDDLHMWTFSINDGQYCFALSDTVLSNDPMDHPLEFQSIKLRILAADSAVSAWKYAMKEFEFIKRPARIPSKALFTHPIWPVQTFPISPNYLNILTMMNEFCAKNDELHFPKAHLYLNGDLEPAIKNFKITARLPAGKEHPFLQILQNGHLIAVEFTPLIKNKNGQLSDIVLEAGTLDFSKPKAVNWLVDQLLQFNQTYELDAFMLIDGTVEDFVRKNESIKVFDEVVNKYPNFITTQYVQSVASFKPSGLFFQTAYKLQSAPAFVRLIGNGMNPKTALQQVIPRLLTLSLAGYQFIVTELNPLTPDDANQKVYLQWIQAVLFLPAVQIPFPPWRYSNDTFTTVVGKWLKIRHQVLFSGTMGPTMFELAQKWVTVGEPIIRPMWFADANLAAITDQYMIGDHLIVAPITTTTDDDAKADRKVYLPKGEKWCYMGDGTEYDATDASIEKVIGKPEDHLVIFFLRISTGKTCKNTFDDFSKSLTDGK